MMRCGSARLNAQWTHQLFLNNSDSNEMGKVSESPTCSSLSHSM